MGGLKSLAKDTAIYGLSSIIGRFLNWLLVPLYTYTFLPDEYGIVSYVYSFVGVALVILTYGMETGFFRFANHERWRDPMQVYSTSLLSLAVSSTLFIIAAFMIQGHVAHWLECDAHPSYAMMMVVCVAADAFTALPFSYLRYKKRPIRFALLKMTGIAVNIGLNLFFILLCPWLMQKAPAAVEWFYNPSFGVGYIFLSNLVASLLTIVLLLPELTGFRWRFNGRLWREMIGYSAPLLVLGVIGVMNQNIGTLIFPTLYPGTAEEALAQVGIYNANLKIAIVMVMFTQAFRFAYEPFIFAQKDGEGEDRRQTYSDVMKYFIFFSMVIFLGVMFYLDIIKHLIAPKYYPGLSIVPIVMLGEFFFAVHFNLSLWYKLSDRTQWGAWFSLIGFVVILGLNVLLVPKYSYHGCAWAIFSGYLVIMIVNYFMGQHYYPVPYPLRRIALYLGLAAVMYVLGLYLLLTPYAIVNYIVRAALLIVYIAAILRVERISVAKLAQPLLSKIRR